MSRITHLFQKKKPFIGYLTIGDRGCSFTEEASLALLEGGVDLLELGVPFSDPLADGPVIQRAMRRSLQEKTSLQDCLEVIKNIRKNTNAPLILFSYYNPIFQLESALLPELKRAGADGILIVDLPVFAAEKFLLNAKNVDLHTIFTLSPTTTKNTIEKLKTMGNGFLYYVSRAGTTGMQNSFPTTFHDTARNLKKEFSLPMVAGFGISSRAMASEALRTLDGFVVGSYFVKAIEEGKNPSDLKKIVQEIAPYESQII